MIIKAVWWKEGTEFRYPYPEGYTKEIEIDDNCDLEELRKFANEDSKKGYYLKSLEKKEGRYFKTI